MFLFRRIAVRMKQNNVDLQSANHGKRSPQIITSLFSFSSAKCLQVNQIAFQNVIAIEGTWNPISLRQLEYEAFTHNDLVVVRGPDGQEHMGNKTLGILQYYLSSPRSFSHLVKVNDDVYVRIPRVIGALIGPSGIRSNALYMGHAKVHYGEREDEENMYRYRRDRPSIRKGPAGAIQGTKYARGWGFILSYDVVVKIMKKVEDWDTGKDRHPIWHRNLKHMDGPMIGGYLMGSVKLSNNTDFKAAWQRCTPESIVSSERCLRMVNVLCRWFIWKSMLH